ncbi:hypothetical protein ACGFYY_32730 [Streptomyces sp. NPDC048331]|uniref:hypothetical protein n=1 Tax=Streptomyces sp. NPDC048331 TaxID=3365534 RepID=UPI0037123780
MTTDPAPADPDTEKQLEHLAALALDLVARTGEFAAALIRRQPVSEPAAEIARLAVQTETAASHLDTLRAATPTL